MIILNPHSQKFQNWRLRRNLYQIILVLCWQIQVHFKLLSACLIESLSANVIVVIFWLLYLLLRVRFFFKVNIYCKAILLYLLKQLISRVKQQLNQAKISRKIKFYWNLLFEMDLKEYFQLKKIPSKRGEIGLKIVQYPQKKKRLSFSIFCFFKREQIVRLALLVSSWFFL